MIDRQDHGGAFGDAIVVEVSAVGTGRSRSGSEVARRGDDTPRFGPLKPVGLEDPRTGKRAYAVAQLRQEDAAGRMWSLVGFQTGLKWGDQKTVVQLIPGLQDAEIVRYGVMHRNTYLNAPALLAADMAKAAQVIKAANIHLD